MRGQNNPWRAPELPEQANSFGTQDEVNEF